MVEYSHRHSFLTNIRTYKLGKKALFWQEGEGVEQYLPYGDIISVEGLFNPSRVQGNRYLLRLKTRSLGNIDITNTSYKSYGEFEEHNQTYLPFVESLHKKINEESPATRFIKGISQAGYVASIITAILLLIVLLVAGYFFLTNGLITVVIIKTIFIIIYYPSLIRYIKSNKPGVYDPLKLPHEIFPHIEA